MRTTTGWKISGGTTALERVQLERRDLRVSDIAVRVDYCGVCHSDLHAVHVMDGVVPGHEFIGTVTELGSAAARFAVGDRIAVGTVVDSCGTCKNCLAGEEIYCTTGWSPTYGGPDRVDGTMQQGGYSREYVINEKYAFPLPTGLDPAKAAPLMCAGITVWAPLRKANVGPGSRVAVAGLGGLGHLAVKFAAALGAEVTVLSRTPDKEKDARALGASDFVVTTDEAQVKQAYGSFDLIIDTISATHDLDPEILMLDLDGELSLLGVSWEIPVNNLLLLIGRKRLSSSATGGLPATAEMLAFAAEHGIEPDVEVLPSARVQEALDRLEANDVRYRFVLDLADLDQTPAQH
ncbi:NAD(P)-dependent alcohol dehydrogenase [Streptomyces sp. NPDC056543]|uniref:NAD(P)-dependent alcohol dehydrogenase n=1 Tax=unclassified Streptomyces TaxID=2593676 RepID=UPI00369519FE